MPGQPIVLLHLSDIHFVRGRSEDTYDIDIPVRHELQRDAINQSKQFGRVDAIVVTGDIAYAGRGEEYDTAREWLDEIRASTNCADRIWTVPGNHDFHRPAIEYNPDLPKIYAAFKTMAAGEIDSELAGYLRHADGESLFQPLLHYNHFATPFACDLNRNKPFWQHELTLNDGSTLRVLGLNSALLCSTDQNEGDVVLGSEYVTAMLRRPGVEYLVLCHHPVEWCRNREALNRPLTRLPRLLLFGHKHHQTIYRVEDTVRVISGAVHPDRREAAWLPRYNFLSLAVLTSGSDRRLEVTVYPKLWNEESQAFEAEMHNGNPWRRYRLDLDPWEGPSPAGLADLPSPQVRPLREELEPTPATAPLTAVTREAALASRFGDLPFHRRIEVIRRLGLLDDDATLPEDELFRRVFRRARERRALSRLWDEINREHPQALDTNPFAEG